MGNNQRRKPKSKDKHRPKLTDLAAINGVPIALLKLDKTLPPFRGAPAFGFVKAIYSTERDGDDGERIAKTAHNAGDQEEIWRRLEKRHQLGELRASVFEEIDRVVQDALPAMFFTGDLALQRSAITGLLYAVELAQRQKVAARGAGHCNQADFWFGKQSLLHALAHLIEVWIDIKCNLPRRAWIHKVDSENYLRVARIAMTSCGLSAGDEEIKHIDCYAAMLDAMDDAIFPPLMFASVGFTFSSASCSVCHMDMSACAHVEGRVYCGKYCAKINLKDLVFDHIARVDEPYDRRSILLSYTDGNVCRDAMTGQVIEGEPGTLLATVVGRLTLLPDIAN